MDKRSGKKKKQPKNSTSKDTDSVSSLLKSPVIAPKQTPALPKK